MVSTSISSAAVWRLLDALVRRIFNRRRNVLELDLLLRRLLGCLDCHATHGVVITAVEARSYQMALLQLIEQRLLVAAPPAATITCPDCDDGELLTVFHLDETEPAVWFVNCPDCGLVQVTAEQLQRWRFSLARVAAFLAQQLSCPASPTKLANVPLWVLGNSTAEGLSQQFYLASFATPVTSQALAAHRVSNLSTVVFYPVCPSAELAPSTHYIRLDQIMRVDTQTVVLDRALLVTLSL